MHRDPLNLDGPAPGTSRSDDIIGTVLAVGAVVLTLLTVAVQVFR